MRKKGPSNSKKAVDPQNSGLGPKSTLILLSLLRFAMILSNFKKIQISLLQSQKVSVNTYFSSEVYFEIK